MAKLMKGMSKRDGLLVSLLFATGLRISEALGIRLADLAGDGEWTDIKVLGKGKRSGRCARRPA